jgi:hypothetical protein
MVHDAAGGGARAGAATTAEGGMNEREKIHRCALRGELDRCEVLGMACGAAAAGLGAVAWLGHGMPGWEVFGGLAGVDAAVLVACVWRAARIRRRLVNLGGMA